MSFHDLIDVESLLVELDPARPCGDNLEYDPAFLAVEEAISGKEELQYGDMVLPAIPPDWRIIHSLSSDLITRTRDLRVAVAITRAGLFFSNIHGFAVGLSLIERLIKERWDSVHPQLDPADNFDPTIRVNILSSLVEFKSVLSELLDAPLVNSRTHGQITLRDIEAIHAGSAGNVNSNISLELIEAALLEIDIDVLKQTLASLANARESARQIEDALTERVGASRSISLAPLSKMLKRGCDFIQERITQRINALAVAAQDCGGQKLRVTGFADRPQEIAGDINSRADVVRVLERICRFYAMHEPSSPIPLLLQRAQRLVDKSFIEVLRDFAPEGMRQACEIGGIDNE